VKLADRPAANLAALMEARGLGQRRLAAMVWPRRRKEWCDTTGRARIRHVLDGTRSNPDTLEAIAKALEIDPGELFQEPGR